VEKLVVTTVKVTVLGHDDALGGHSLPVLAVKKAANLQNVDMECRIACAKARNWFEGQLPVALSEARVDTVDHESLRTVFAHGHRFRVVDG
jgi:hypothetical protein